MIPANFVVVLGFVATSLVTSAGHGAVLKVGANQTYKNPSEAAAAAKNGDRIEIDPGQYFDCAVWRADDLVIEGTAPGVVITDKTCMGKALFVVAGNNTTIRRLTLTRARVPDMNGAGIRLDQGNLTVEDVEFIDNQSGILGGIAGTTVIVRNSNFERNGFCGGACAHGIYVADVKLLRVENTRSYNTLQGHSVKSRVLQTEIINCNIADGPDGTSSYLVDVPNGGSLLVDNNIFQKGPKSQNHKAAIAIGEEGVTHPTQKIIVMNSKFTNDSGYETTFVWNVTATPATLSGNHFVGPIIALTGDRFFAIAEKQRARYRESWRRRRRTGFARDLGTDSRICVGAIAGAMCDPPISTLLSPEIFKGMHVASSLMDC